MFLSQRTMEEVQNDRDAVLSTTPANIREFSQMVSDVLKQKSLCVYGNADRLTTEQLLFMTLVKVDGSDHPDKMQDTGQG
jgi:Zn-dependent M16 (insulinase) family peptidase